MEKTKVSKKEMRKIIDDVLEARKYLLQHLDEYTVNCIANFIDARLKLLTSTLGE